MAVISFANGTQTATITTEHTLTGVNVAGRYKLVIDLVNMASGDILELRVYQTVLASGTNEHSVLYTFFGAQDADFITFSSDYFDNPLTDSNSLKFTLKQTAGTGRNFPWNVLSIQSEPTNFTLLAIDASGRVDVGKALGTAVTLDSNNVLNVSTKYLAGTALTGRDIGASVLLSPGSGTGQLDFTSGVVKANLAQILGTALTETAGLLAAGFKQFFNIASPTSTMNTITTVTTATNLTTNNDKTGYSLTAATGLGNQTSNITGNLSGSVGSVTGAVGSVTGAVGSVTGNVGGNVVGSVASVTARVTANADQFGGQTVTAAAGVTVPSSIASPTNITAGTITTATNLTNSPTAGDFTAAMKTSLNAATPAVTVSDKTGFSLTAGYDPAKTASQAGDAMALTSGERTTLTGVIWAQVIETGYTAIQILRLISASVVGKLSGAATTSVVIRDVNDTKDRITATVDSDGNRTAVTKDVS